MNTDLLLSIVLTGLVAALYSFALTAANNTRAARRCRREWQKTQLASTDEVDPKRSL